MMKRTLVASMGTAFLVSVSAIGAGCASTPKPAEPAAADAAAKPAEGSCGAEKGKEGSCGAEKGKEGSCGAEKGKEGSCGAAPKG